MAFLRGLGRLDEHRILEASNIFPETKKALHLCKALICAPSMGAILEVQVLRRAGHSEASEAQLREGDRAWGGSAERKP
jgi:hypothetical protein